MSNENGGPAFPLHVPTAMRGDASETSEGMSLRDYFAAGALQSIVGWVDGPAKKDGETYQEAMARLSYEYADAMLKERAK